MMSDARGFSFIEVIAALVILSISLVILLDTQGRSMDLVAKARSLDQAVMLAGSKMAEVLQEAEQKGVTAIRNEDSGEFDREKFDGYRWRYWIVQVPAPDFKTMLGVVEGAETEDARALASNLGAVEGYLQNIGDAWGKALRELHVEVAWGGEVKPRTYELVTHLLAPDAKQLLENVVPL